MCTWLLSLVHECAWECVWIITCLQGRLPVESQIEALSCPKWPPGESDEKGAVKDMVRRGGGGGKTQNSSSQSQRWDLNKRQTENTQGENDGDPRLTEQAESTSGLSTRVFIDRELFRSFLIGKCLKPNRGKEEKAAWKQQQDNCSLWPSTILHLLLPTAYHQQFDVCFSVIFCAILNENEIRWSMQLNLQFMVCSIIRQ